MTNESSTWVDVKVKVEGDLLFHLELRGYRSDADMTVQKNYLERCNALPARHLPLRPLVCGHALSGVESDRHFVRSGRQALCLQRYGGVVVALDFPLCHFEITGSRPRPQQTRSVWMLIAVGI